MAKTGRKAELRRLAAKKGWYDGNSGMPPNPPERVIMLPNGRPGYRSVPKDEEQAYWEGFFEGEDSKNGDRNPYGVYD
jgi:hypothetical protein